MTIEIKELIIKATVSSDVEKEKKPAGVGKEDTLDENKIVRRCVEQALRILKREKER